MYMFLGMKTDHDRFINNFITRETVFPKCRHAM